MPATQQQNDLDPEEFAKLMARFDTGNPSEAEAMNAGRLMRRGLVSKNLRLVDVMCRPEVMLALDAQLQPVRHASAELIEARKIADDLRQEVTERVRQVTQLALALKQEQETAEGLRRRCAGAARTGSHTTKAPQASTPSLGDDSDGEWVNGELVAVVVVGVVVLLVSAALR